MTYTEDMATAVKKMPSKEKLGQIAQNQPELLNILVAYFVFEWKSCRPGNPSHGVDQCGKTRQVPDYIDMWSDRHTGRSGVDNALHILLQCPSTREPDGPGFLSEWLQICAAAD